MTARDVHVVTGAFGYSGRCIARQLLAAGRPVRTLTNSPERAHEFGDAIEVRPLAFDDPPRLVESLRDGAVLYNTYWVRFNHKLFTFDEAVRNTITLFEAAREAGVPRIVHTSITNPSEDSPYPYFAGKARLERELGSLGVPHVILRPNVLFGRFDILVNNIAWALRRLPVFGVFGDGRYRLQPMHVDDFAALAVETAGSEQTCTIDAIGPETFTYRRLVETVAGIIGLRRRIVSVPMLAGLAVAKALDLFTGDVLVTRDEIGALMDDLLVTDSEPTGTTKLTDWARRHSETLGRRYANEVGRRTNRVDAYEQV